MTTQNTFTPDFVAIIQNCTSREDLRYLNRILIDRLNDLTRAEAQTFSRGDQVEFTTRRRQKVTGTVTKVNIKTVKVRDSARPESIWTVSPNLLTRV